MLLSSASILCSAPLIWPVPSPLSMIIWVSELVLRHRQRCSKCASHCCQIYTATQAPLIRSACSIAFALCVRARGLVTQFAGECRDASGKWVWAPQAASNPHRGHPQPTSTPWEATGGQPRPAFCREPALWPRSGRGGLGGGGGNPPGGGGAGQGALHGPRRHLGGSGELRGRSGWAFRRPQGGHCAVTTHWKLVLLYIWSPTYGG
jgi:hypothetical protein